MKRTLLIFLTILMPATLAACGGRHAAPAQQVRNGPQTAATLADALSLIEAAEAAGGKAAKALPETQTGDQAWIAGPSGNFTVNPGTLNLISQAGGVDNPQYLAFGIYQLPGHTGDIVGKLDLNLTYSQGQYYIYMVKFAGTPQWMRFGPYSAAPAAPTFPLTIPFNAVAPSGNVYVAVVTNDVADVTVNSLTIDAGAVNPTYTEVEDNEVAGDDSDRSAANALPAFPFSGTSVWASMGGNTRSNYDGYDEDNIDWFSFVITEPGTVSLQMNPQVNGGAGEGDLDMELWDAAGTVKLEDSIGTVSAERIDYHLGTPGTYYLKTRSVNVTSDQYGDYSLWGRFWPDSAGNSIYYETEPNDTYTVADALPALPFEEGIVLGNVGDGGQYDGSADDWYSFTIATQQIVRTNLYCENKIVSPELTLFAADGTTEIDTDTTYGDVRKLANLLMPGTYYLRVEETSSTTNGNYELAMTAQDFTPGSYYETEDNDDFGTADALPGLPFTYSQVNGSLGAGGGYYDGDDVDWYSLNVTSPGTVKIRLHELEAGAANLDMFLYDTDGTTELVDSNTVEEYEGIHYNFTSTGTYYIKCAASSGGSDYELQGEFDATPGPYFEQENNDDYLTSNALPAFPFNASQVTGNAGLEGATDADEPDWYSFTLASAAAVHLVMDIDTVGGDIDIKLIDTDGTTELESSTGTDAQEEITSQVLPAGTYYVWIYAYPNDTDASDYTLTGDLLP